MNLSLTLEEEAKLVAQAQARGTTPEALVREAIEPILSAATENGARKETRPIWDVLVENMKDVPPEDLALLPKDGASQIDHYIYTVCPREPDAGSFCRHLLLGRVDQYRGCGPWMCRGA